MDSPEDTTLNNEVDQNSFEEKLESLRSMNDNKYNTRAMEFTNQWPVNQRLAIKKVNFEFALLTELLAETVAKYWVSTRTIAKTTGDFTIKTSKW